MVGAVVSVGAGAGIRTEFTEASHPAWWIVVGCGAVVFVLALASTGEWARRRPARWPACSTWTHFLHLSWSVER